MPEMRAIGRNPATERRVPGNSIHVFFALDSSVAGKPDKGEGDTVLR